tara:strand:- start:160 stop:801 length:642 start_codon:yes stop_codon:yes gene_type:complete
MYELRGLDASYLGLYLLVLFVLFVFLKLLKPNRYHSILFFWERINSNTEFIKPFNQNKAFSFIGFLFRAFMFGLMAQVFITESLGVATYNATVLWWAGGFMLFWTTRTLIEGGLLSILRKREELLKLFYIRAIFKEKWAFLFCCLSILLINVSMSPMAANILALSYVLGLIGIHLRFGGLYFKTIPTRKVYIILYICTSEIGPIWLLIQTLKL